MNRIIIIFSEYDPNPLLSLSKRKRRTSASVSTEERRTNQSQTTAIQQQKPAQLNQSNKQIKSKDDVTEKENKDVNKQDLIVLSTGDTSTTSTASTTAAFLHHHREKKRMKKRKRDKLKEKILRDDNKKRKKKHKCNNADEYCKHKRHHKKHRKHKKHHHQHEKTEVDENEKSDNATVKKDGGIKNKIQADREQNDKDNKCKKRKIDVDEGEETVPNTDNQVTLDDILEAKSKVNSQGAKSKSYY